MLIYCVQNDENITLHTQKSQEASNCPYMLGSDMSNC